MTPAQSIVSALHGQWLGQYGMAPCVSHDDGTTPALKISDDPRKHDGIDVICFAGCCWQNVKRELARRGLLLGCAAAAAIDTPNLEPKRERYRSSHGAAAAALWKSARDPRDTIIKRYLEARGLRSIPLALRYLARAKHSPTRSHFPCLLAAVTVWPSLEVCAVHRTFLAADGSGKAPVVANKMMLGRCAGGVVRLAPVAAELGIGEGIESALSAMQMTRVPTWAALSTSGIMRVILPPEVRSVVIFGDNDANGAGKKAAEFLACRLRSEGRRVRIEYPPGDHKDFNDALQAGAR